MELVSLDIERFGRVGRARIAFGSGLNVLHGANEVGKSSIAQAIRFVLLVPPSSNEIKPYVSWSGGGDPTVTLVFRSGMDHYRVKKVFGTTTASLERSSDGIGWSSIARGREVEARVRALLEWGIPEPGGARGPRGMPESFLAAALLAEQDDVDGILGRDLEGDGADSGRIRVRGALQALAQDPLFKRVLDEAQRRVDEAFTGTGKQSRASSSPFKRIADKVTGLQRERDDAEGAAENARLLAERVAALRSRAAQAGDELQTATAERQALDARHARQEALAKAARARLAGQALVDAALEAEMKLESAEKMLGEILPRIPDLEKAAEEARTAFEAATAGASAAREKRVAELEREDAAVLRDRVALGARQTRLDLERDLRRADALSRETLETETALKALDGEIAVLEAVEPWLELQGIGKALEEASAREKRIANLRKKAEDLRSRGAAEWPTAVSSRLPDQARLDALRELSVRLATTEGKLDVGLSVEVLGKTSAKVSVDGGESETRASPLEVEARKAARLELKGGIVVSVQGGRASDRGEAERLRKEWRDSTAVLFEAAGASDLPGIEEACRLDSEKKSRYEALAREADAADAERTALGDPAAERERLEARRVELAGRIEGTDRGLIEAAAAAHGPDARAVLAGRRADSQSRHSDLATLRAQEAALRERCGAKGTRESIDDPDAEAAAIAVIARELDARSKKVAEEREALEEPAGGNDALETAAAKAKEALEDAHARSAAANRDRDGWSARLEERRRALDGVDLAALTRAEADARAAARDDGDLVDDAEIASARKAEDAARTRSAALAGELRETDGHLRSSGGAAADERLRDLEAALESAQEKQAQIEDQFEAWKLLAETLKDAERSQATHLGNVLAPDLAARLRALAGQRYSGVALSPHLRLDGVEAGGERREWKWLSIGTREQLSTLLRLCIAERLHSTLLLDDQLVQSDPDRLRWFRHALRQTGAAGVQVIVLTCRPDDYLEPAETPPPHVIDLGAAVMAEP